MAYPDFSAFDLRQQFGVQFRADTLFPEVASIAPSVWLQESLRKEKSLALIVKILALSTLLHRRC